jgi:hypothetical protein
MILIQIENDPRQCMERGVLDMKQSSRGLKTKLRAGVYYPEIEPKRANENKAWNRSFGALERGSIGSMEKVGTGRS